MRSVTVIILLFATASFAQDYFEAVEEIPEVDGTLLELESSLVYSPDDPTILYNLALRYQEAGDWEKARGMLYRLEELKPSSAFVEYAVGEFFSAKGETDSAVYHYEKALELHYEYPVVWEKLVLLEPKYLFNLGMLYKEKADSLLREDVAEKAIQYLEEYKEKNPGGMYVADADAAIESLRLLEGEIKASARKREREEQKRALLVDERKRRIEERNRFLRERPTILGGGLRFWTPGNTELEFKVKEGVEVPEPMVVETGGDTVVFTPTEDLSVKRVMKSASGVALSGGRFFGPLWACSSVYFGGAHPAYSYKKGIDTTLVGTPYDPYVRGTINTVSVFELTGEARYNICYYSPLVVYIGTGGGLVYILPHEKTPYFDSVLSGDMFASVALLFGFHNIVACLSFRRGFLGSSQAGVVDLLVYYKIF
ncbi:hypothetical protein J7K18_05490 [bacterium]|nr:hypothetical protein [bacterium]